MEIRTRILLSEFLGTFFLVFAGTGAIVINEATAGVIGHAGIALTFGLVVLAMIYTFGELSGAHLNPAVTIGFYLARRFKGSAVAPYMLAQFSGAFCASGVLRALFPASTNLGATIPHGSSAQSLVIELILTFFLMMVILRVSTGAKEKGITAGIVVGSVIALEAMFAGPISGASMNPARSIAPAVLSGHTDALWVYLVGTVAGAALAVPASLLLGEPQLASQSN
ncbi:MAG: MIP/aquaporin family protein [Limisphaerales bacterium]